MATPVPSLRCLFCGKPTGSRRQVYCNDKHKHRLLRLRQRWKREGIWELLLYSLNNDAVVDEASPLGAQDFNRQFWDHVADNDLLVNVRHARKK